MRIILATPRDWSDFDRVAHVMDKLTARLEQVEIVCGFPTGFMASAWAFRNRKVYHVYHPNDDRDQSKAQHVANIEMVKNADSLVAFFDGSPIISHLINEARSKGLPTRVIELDEGD